MLAFAESFWELPPPFNMVVMIMTIIFGSWMLCELAGHLRKYFSHRGELALKRDLVERGLSVDEIERVVNSGIQPDAPNPAQQVSVTQDFSTEQCYS